MYVELLDNWQYTAVIKPWHLDTKQMPRVLAIQDEIEVNMLDRVVYTTD